MTERSATHATFVVERTYDATPARVFAAWADPEAKSQWFGNPDGAAGMKHDLDFRVGGSEHNSGAINGGPTYRFDAYYQDIVPNARIVYTYDMHLDDQRISVSVTTVEFTPDGSGMRLVFTEQGVFLDGLDNATQREQGTGELLDQLGAALQRQSAGA